MPTILILSNNQIAPLIRLLAEDGHNVIEARDGDNLLQRVMGAGLDCVVLPEEVELPDGQEALPVVRKLTDEVIVVVGQGGEGKMARALFMGADAYLQYPDELALVRSRFRAVLRRRQALRPKESRGDATPGIQTFSALGTSL